MTQGPLELYNPLANIWIFFQKPGFTLLKTRINLVSMLTLTLRRQYQKNALQ